MKKEQLEALGLTPDQIKGVQWLNGQSIEKAKQNVRIQDGDVRAAINAILQVISKRETLENILRAANRQYYFETTPPMGVRPTEERVTPCDSESAPTVETT